MIKESKKKLQRGTERHRVTIPVQVSVFEGKQYVEFPGEASDFSPNGLCLILTRQLEKGAAISMNLNLPYNSRTLDLRGIVRHRSGFHHGIEFISLTPPLKQLLERTAKILGLLS
ncbi:MAG TPA: PilZ domain-containing protein [Terriglobales bacterium]|nr:PilZ domain-containing protein [Terriglobales bacterium]